MLLKDVIEEAGIATTHKMSARRALQDIMDRSNGAIPLADLVAMLKVITAALDVNLRN